MVMEEAGRKRTFFTCNLPAFILVVVLLYNYFVSFSGLLLGKPYSPGPEWQHKTFAAVFSTLTLASLYGAALSHPGRVPQNWISDILPTISVGANSTEGDILDYQAKRREVLDGFKYCKVCDLYKPERTHHCRQCDHCVTRYDHHCDWIDNCVGQRNHKLFILFLLYIDMCIVHYFVLVFYWVGEETKYRRADRSHLATQDPDRVWHVVHTVMLTLYSFLVLPMALFGLCFFGWAMFLVGKGETSLENAVPGDRTYNAGVYANIAQVFGSNPLLWLIPVTNKATGVHFPSRQLPVRSQFHSFV